MDRVIDIALESVHEASPALQNSRKRKLLSNIPGWQVENMEGVEKLSREFTFKDYPDTVGFANCVAGIADSDKHYPTIVIEENSVKVIWWTRMVRGLHENDFIMAAKVNQII